MHFSMHVTSCIPLGREGRVFRITLEDCAGASVVLDDVAPTLWVIGAPFDVAVRPAPPREPEDPRR